MRRIRRSADRLTLPEAERIRQQQAAGRLDEHDDDVRRVLAEANRRSVRADLWGRTREARRTSAATAAVVGGGVLLFIGGLVAEFVLSRH